MAVQKTEITICLGSSCFARGNKKIVTIIQEYIKQNKLEDKVRFKGNHCFGKCNVGPVLKINEIFYEGVEEGSVQQILDNALESLKAEQNWKDW